MEASNDQSTPGVHSASSPFNIFTNGWDDGLGCTLSKFADNTKLRVATSPKALTAIQADFSRLEKWLTKTCRSSTSAESCTWGGTPAGKQLDRKGPGSPGGHRAERASAPRPCCQDGCGVRYHQKARRGLPLHPALVGPHQECCVHFCLFPPQNLAFSLVPLTVLRDNETQQDCGGPCTDMAFVYLPWLYRCDKLHRFVSRGWKGKVKQSSVGFCSSLLFLFLIT